MDHFGVWAQDVYTTGHSIALDLAEQGREKKPDGTTRSSCERLSALQEAYLAESFAAHFLTDLFSAGHLRACRREFHQTPCKHLYPQLLSKRYLTARYNSL